MGEPRGALMNSRWIRADKILLTCFVMAVVLVGALAFLVARQQHDLAKARIDQQVSGQTVPVASAPPHASTLDSAQTPRQPGSIQQVPAQPAAAAVDGPSQASTSQPAQTPTKADTSAPVQDQHGAAVVTSPLPNNPPQPAHPPSNSDASPQPPDHHRATPADVPSRQGGSDSAVVPGRSDAFAPGRDRRGVVSGEGSSRQGGSDSGVVPGRSQRLTNPGASFKPHTQTTSALDNNDQANGAGSQTENDQSAESR
jgi:hypothetical protein